MKRAAAIAGVVLAAVVVRGRLKVRDALPTVAPELRSPLLPFTATSLTDRTLPVVRLLFRIPARPGRGVTVVDRNVGEPPVRAA